MCRHLCKLCKKTFQLKIELIIHERKDHGAMKDNQIPETPPVHASKLLVSSHGTRPENWIFNKNETRTSTSAPTSPNSAEGVSSTNYEIQTQKRVTFKLTSTLGVLPQMPVVIKTEKSRESDKSLNRECSTQRNMQSIGIHLTDNSKRACGTDILTMNNKNSNEVISVKEDEDDDDDIVPKIVSSESLSPCEASTFITGDVLDILRTKKKRKSTPCKMNEVKKRFLRSQSGCLNIVSTNMDNSHLDASRSDAGYRYGSLITCVTCSKTVRNRAKLVLHLRKNHSRAQAASMMRKRNSATSESSIISSNNFPVIVYQKPSILKRWRCKKCGKHFDRHVKLWKHRIQTCGLVFGSNNYNVKPTALNLQELVKNTSSYVSRPSLPHVTPTNTERDSTSENIDIFQMADDVNLIKCPWQDCNLFCADRIQLVTHAQEFHSIFMCRLCESVMLSISQRDAHYLKVHNSLEEHSVNRELTKHAGSDKCFVVTTDVELLPKNAFPIIREISTVERSIAAVDGGGNIEPNNGIPRRFSKYSEDEFEGGVGSQPKVLIRQIDSVNCGGPPTPGTTDSIGSLTKRNEGVPLIKPKQLMTCSLCNSSFFQTRLYLKHKKECRGKLANPTIPNSSIYPNEALTLSSIKSNLIIEQSSNQAMNSRVYSSMLDASSRPSRSGISTLKCNGCSQTFRSSNSLQSHVQEASCRNKIYKYECEYCHQGFSRDASLKNHINSQHTESTTDDSSDKKYDTVMKSEKNTQCKICEKILATVRGLNSHMRTQHPLNLRNMEPSLEKSADSTIAEMHWSRNTAELVSRCSPAGMFSDGRSANLKRPLSYNSNPGSSPKIARVGPLHEPRSRNSHFQTHQKYQPVLQLKCNECGDTFNERDELAQHLLDHNEVKSSPKILRGVRKTGTTLSQLDLEKLHNCVICGGLFHELKDMILHVDAEHSRKGKYACMQCEKIFSVAMELVIHSQTHKKPHGSPIISEPQKKIQTKRKDNVFQGGKAKAITCPKCNLVFADNPTFRVHWQSHWDWDAHQEILYPCPNDNCKQTFSSLLVLNRHVKQAHPEVTVLVCTFPGCEIPFTHSLGLQRHLRDAHNISGTNADHTPSSRGRVRFQE